MTQDFRLRPIAAWNLRAIMAHFEDGRARIERGLEQDVYVEMLGSISLRIEWRNRRKPADGHVFTHKGMWINDTLMTISEPEAVHIGRWDAVDAGTTLDRLVRFEGLPELPAVPIDGGRYRNGESDYILARTNDVKLSEILT